MTTVTAIPGNDLIMRLGGHLSFVGMAALLVLVNYLALLLLMVRRPDQRRRLWGDSAYHVVWTILIPIGFGFLIPSAYRRIRDAFAGIQQVLPAPENLADSGSTQQAFHDWWLVSALTAVVAVLLVVVVWPRWLRRFTDLQKANYWWYDAQKRGFTIPGKFFLLMCAVLTWSLLTFLTNVVYDQFAFARLVSESESLMLSPTQEDRLNGLRPFQDFTNAVLIVWSAGTITVCVLGFARSRARVATASTTRDRLFLVNLAVSVAVLLSVSIPIVSMHEILVDQKARLYGLGETDKATLYPEWPVDMGALVGFVPQLFSTVFSVFGFARKAGLPSVSVANSRDRQVARPSRRAEGEAKGRAPNHATV